MDSHSSQIRELSMRLSSLLIAPQMSVIRDLQTRLSGSSSSVVGCDLIGPLLDNAADKHISCSVCPTVEERTTLGFEASDVSLILGFIFPLPRANSMAIPGDVCNGCLRYALMSENPFTVLESLSQSQQEIRTFTQDTESIKTLGSAIYHNQGKMRPVRMKRVKGQARRRKRAKSPTGKTSSDS
ncbi:hypothetical protein 4 [Tree fern varicosa-like virus]|uniref:Uncharacterized protein n=1 Tax=Tree fern varicosa-like virus TaxID=2933191 RepID=A0A9C7GX36_9RHAB|nr:hypothetical protein 4 [Tree fern varicosa-like virus]CAI5383999.1 hypothetical protein 4 [Tree fern varicosa-like virus]